MKSIIVFCAALTVVCALGSEDYYWRDYVGIVPEDAFVASGEVDECGVEQNMLYIGQVYVHGVGLLIGGLTPGKPHITTTGGIELDHRVYSKNRNVKILCTRSPQKFQWFSTNRTHIQQHKDLNFVIGGAQAAVEGALSIGRVYHHGWRIGKLDGYWPGNIDIYFPCNGKELSRAVDTFPDTQYEVLIYSPQSGAPSRVDSKLRLAHGH